MSQNRKDRLRVLQELLQVKEIATQQQLAESMKEAGFEATQVSLSRDLSFLGVIKRDGKYCLPEIGANSHILNITQAGDNLLVVRTTSGMAVPLAYRIDGAKIDGVLGTIAGEDTIFVATRSEAAIGRVRQILTTQLQ